MSGITDKTNVQLSLAIGTAFLVGGLIVRNEIRSASMEYGIADLRKDVGVIRETVTNNVPWPVLTGFAELLQAKNPNLIVPIPRK